MLNIKEAKTIARSNINKMATITAYDNAASRLKDAGLIDLSDLAECKAQMLRMYNHHVAGDNDTFLAVCELYDSLNIRA